MNSSELMEMREDRLANFAAAAFIGSLLMGQSWERWEGSRRTINLLVFTVADYWGLVLLTLTAGLFALSLYLAAASMITPLQRSGLSVARWASWFMLPIVAGSFALSWLPSFLELPQGQWWSPVFSIGGFAMFIFIGFRSMVTSFFRYIGRRITRAAVSKPIDDTELGGRNGGEPSGTPDRITFFERMCNLRSIFRMPESRGFWATVSTIVVIIEVILVVTLWDWLVKDESGSATIRNIGLVIAGSVAIPLAIWRAVAADKQASSAQHQAAIAQQGLLNERYQKAAEMLGHDNLSVRLGGVYALQALIQEHPEQYYVSCMHLLCAFVRNPPADQQLPVLSDRELTRHVGGSRLRGDVQAVMDLMRLRDDRLVALEREKGFEVNFQGADLRGSNLRSVNFTRVDFRGADLSGANARGSNRSHVGLSGARLYKTILARANLSDTWFDGADVSRAWFCVTALRYPDEDYSSRRFTSPAVGIAVHRFWHARAKKGNSPVLGGVVLDAESGTPLVWDPSEGMGIEY
ncbi:MAG: pentapeptide repeat-containing protein [Chloroflexi bacterium]|nr:pentapeptide repeat-containing protein [Chloroflexota bacterium]